MGREPGVWCGSWEPHEEAFGLWLKTGFAKNGELTVGFGQLVIIGDLDNQLFFLFGQLAFF